MNTLFGPFSDGHDPIGRPPKVAARIAWPAQTTSQEEIERMDLVYEEKIFKCDYLVMTCLDSFDDT